MNDVTEKEKKIFLTRTKKRAVYFALFITPLILHWLIFWLYVNMETFILAFQKFTMTIPGEPYDIAFAGLENFKNALNYLLAAPHYYTHALLFYFFQLVLGSSLALFFSYYMYKRLPCASLFKYFLFLPNILSGLLFAILFKFVVSDVYVSIAENWFGTKVFGLMNANNRPVSVRVAVLIVYNIIIGIGSQVLVYTGSMEGIDPSLVESSQLDGANIIQEFWFISMPLIWNTFMVFFLTTMTGIFTTQLNLFNFYGDAAPEDMTVIGYKMYVDTLSAHLGDESIKWSKDSSYIQRLNYPGLAAVSLMITTILTPIVLITRKLMTKFGPSAS